MRTKADVPLKDDEVEVNGGCYEGKRGIVRKIERDKYGFIYHVWFHGDNCGPLLFFQPELDIVHSSKK